MIASLSLPRNLLFAGCLLLASTGFGAVALFEYRHTAVIETALAQSAIYAFAAFLFWRMRLPLSSRRTSHTLIFVIGIAVAMRALLVFAPPHSTDIYRYVWDGRVQANGINPYLYIPADPALQDLRDPEAIYKGINRRESAPTIYPPMAQIVFFFASRLGETVTGMKAAMLAFEAVAVWALIRLLAARGQSPVLAGIYLWHPLPIWEIAGSGHIDIVATAFLLLSLLAAERGQRFASGIALAAGALTKYFPFALTPAIYRRWDWKMPAAFVATAAIGYLPYLAAGTKVFGFLGGYADEELGTGEGLFLAALLKEAGLGDAAVPVFFALAVITLGTLAWRAGFRRYPGDPDLNASFAIAVAFTVFFSPHYAWYFMWLIPFLCFCPLLSVFWLTLSATALYRLEWPPSLLGASIQYVPFAILFVLEHFNILYPKESPDGRAIA